MGESLSLGSGGKNNTFYQTERIHGGRKKAHTRGLTIVCNSTYTINLHHRVTFSLLLSGTRRGCVCSRTRGAGGGLNGTTSYEQCTAERREEKIHHTISFFTLHFIFFALIFTQPPRKSNKYINSIFHISFPTSKQQQKHNAMHNWVLKMILMLLCDEFQFQTIFSLPDPTFNNLCNDLDDAWKSSCLWNI